MKSKRNIKNWNMQSVEMQIHDDTKGKVAVDDITFWDNCCTKMSQKYHFTFSFDGALCKWG